MLMYVFFLQYSFFFLPDAIPDRSLWVKSTLDNILRNLERIYDAENWEKLFAGLIQPKSFANSRDEISINSRGRTAVLHDSDSIGDANTLHFLFHTRECDLQLRSSVEAFIIASPFPPQPFARPFFHVRTDRARYISR